MKEIGDRKTESPIDPAGRRGCHRETDAKLSVAECEAGEHLSGDEAKGYYRYFLGGLLLGLVASIAEAVVPIPGLHVFFFRWGLLIGALLFGAAVFTSSANLIRRVPVFRKFLLLLLPFFGGAVAGVLLVDFLFRVSRT